MRLAFSILKYFPFGGLQRNFLDIAQALVHRGHDITVYTTHWDGVVPPGLNLKYVSVCRLTNHERVHQFGSRVCALLRHEQFDAVVGFNKMPGLDVYYAGDPCYEILTRRRHDERLGPFTWVRWLNPRYHRYRSLERVVFNPQAKTHILMLSTAQEREYIGQYGTQQARCHQLPPSMLADRQPIADQARTRQKFRKQWCIPEDEFVLLMTGSCLKTKGLDRAIHAFSSLPAATRSRCRLLAVGDDRARTFLPLAKKLGIHNRIRICGPQTDIPTFMVGSDVLLHPAYTDNTGTVLLESMAYALPSVVTEVCGYAHYIRKANAGTVLPSPFAQASLNRALLDMLSSPHRIQWGKNGANYIKTLDLSSRACHAAAIVETVARKRADALATS